ncbi:MAG: ATP-binding cassette domain-containing protein [Clostridia bacterium]|nr:ATP-binding cassette domain-containing protein [Clostridia bacterium]
MQRMLCEHIWHHIEGRMLLRDISLPRKESEIICLLGDTGSGKTTLLRILAGILAPSRGQSHLHYVRMATEEALSPRLTTEENLLRALKIRGTDKALTQSRLDRLLTVFRLEDFRFTRCENLSHGEKELLSAACAVATRPGVLLLDMPCMMRDMHFALKTLMLENGMTVIYTARNVSDALYTADRIAFLHDGRILQLGTPEELMDHPAAPQIMARFGDCAVLRGTVSGVQKDKKSKKDPAEKEADAPVHKKCALDVKGMTLDCLCPEDTDVEDDMIFMIRADRLHAFKSPQPFGQNLCGEITGIQHAFGEETLQVTLPSGDIVPVSRRAETFGGHRKWETGDKVFLCWDIFHGHLFHDAPFQNI